MNSLLPPPSVIWRIVEAAIAEDTAAGDPTTETLIPADRLARAVIVSKESGVLCGGPIAQTVFATIDPSISIEWPLAEGDSITPGSVIANLEGSAAAILMAERTALNFLQHLSGISTLTSRYVSAVNGTRAIIVDTRKTLPGMRALQKYAVGIGGARNHRTALGDGILIKDNHIKVLCDDNFSVKTTVANARSKGRHALRVEVEVENIPQLMEAIEGGADVVMLDNMDIETIEKAVAITNERVVLEASGGITLDTVQAVAKTGVDVVSVGALTHSAPALDMSLQIIGRVNPD